MKSRNSTMKLTNLALAFGLALCAVASLQAQQVPQPKSAADISGTPPGTVMTKEYVAMVGRFAYVWGWPLVNNLNRSRAVEKLPEPGLIGGIGPVSPPGQICTLTDYIDPAERLVT